MTDQAVYVLFIVEVERSVFPAITDVAAGANRFVGRYGNTEIVNDVVFA